MASPALGAVSETNAIATAELARDPSETARCLAATVRRGDVVARVRGEEFALVLPGAGAGRLSARRTLGDGPTRSGR